MLPRTRAQDSVSHGKLHDRQLEHVLLFTQNITWIYIYIRYPLYISQVTNDRLKCIHCGSDALRPGWPRDGSAQELGKNLHVTPWSGSGESFGACPVNYVYIRMHMHIVMPIILDCCLFGGIDVHNNIYSEVMFNSCSHAPVRDQTTRQTLGKQFNMEEGII